MTTHYSVRDVAFGTTVFDVDTKERIDHVMSIDTYSGELELCCMPPHLDPKDRNRIETHTIKFRSIYPISGGARLPCLFHCYGRLA